jgi:hypothetical protein
VGRDLLLPQGKLLVSYDEKTCSARLARRGRPRQLHDQHEDSDVLEIRAKEEGFHR